MHQHIIFYCFAAYEIAKLIIIFYNKYLLVYFDSNNANAERMNHIVYPYATSRLSKYSVGPGSQ